MQAGEEMLRTSRAGLKTCLFVNWASWWCYLDDSAACWWQTVSGMEAWNTKDHDMNTSSPSLSRD